MFAAMSLSPSRVEGTHTMGGPLAPFIATAAMRRIALEVGAANPLEHQARDPLHSIVVQSRGQVAVDLQR